MAGYYIITRIMRRQKYITGSNWIVKKYLALIGGAITAIILGLALMYGSSNSTQVTQEPVQEAVPITEEQENPLVVKMIMLSSRPGCETTGCYLPSTITVDAGSTITWINEDRGLHTVTTGYYDTPDGMVESGHVSPEDKFSFTFDTPGQFHYYCRLHPWMEGTVIVN